MYKSNRSFSQYSTKNNHDKFRDVTEGTKVYLKIYLNGENIFILRNKYDLETKPKNVVFGGNKNVMKDSVDQQRDRKGPKILTR